MSDTDEELFQQTGHVKLKEGICLEKLLQGQHDTFEINYEKIDNEEVIYNPRDVDLSDLTSACLGLGLESDDDDDNTDDSLSPFEKLSKKMVDIYDNGKIKKKIQREGHGDNPPYNSMVSVYYSSYLEYHDEPTDFSFLKKSYKFRLGTAGVAGLNIAVHSMKTNEKAVFLIHPDYAFGKMGHPPRIPANATFLFQVELIRFVDVGAIQEYDALSSEERQQFPHIYKTAQALIENANEYFKANVRLAIRDYNKAVSLLEHCNLRDMNDQEKQQKLLLRLYTNLAVCHTQENNARKACTMCNNIYDIAKNTSLKIPAKVYFHNGRALFMLREYKKARDKLLIAQKLEPNNIEICSELAKVDERMKEDLNKERAFAQKFLFNTETPEEKPTEDENSSDAFTIQIRNIIDDLLADEYQQNFKLPGGLSEKEKRVVQTEALKKNLNYEETKDVGKTVIMISK